MLAVACLGLGACGGDDGDPVADAGTSTVAGPESSDEGAVAGSLLDENAFGEPYLGPLTFAWPRDCTVPVRETVVKDGQQAELEYSLVLAGEGDSILVAFDDLRVAELGGREVTEELEEAVSAAFLLPGFVVGPAGEVTGVRGMDELLERMATLDPRLEQLASEPAAVAALEATVSSKYWDVWVGLWAAWGSFEQAVEVLPDAGPDNELELQSVGTLPGGRAAFRHTEVLSGPALGAQLNEMMGDLAAGAGTDAGEAEAAAADFKGRRRTTIEVVTDPATLRPDSAYLYVTIALTADGESRLRSETRTTRFDWADSDCA